MGRWSRISFGVLCVVGGALVGGQLWSPAAAAPVDLAYTAVPPCVAFDSRTSPSGTATGGFAGPINGAQAVIYQVAGAAIPLAQGGGSADCGVPTGADAVEINVVAVNALNEGNLRVTDGSATATGGVVNYNALTPKLNTANSVTIPLNASGQLVVTPNCGAGCTVDTTHVRGIVLGYFSDGLAQRLAAVEAKLQDVTRLASGVGGQPTLQFSGVNVQIVDGSGTTTCSDGVAPQSGETCNGRGNLVLGYAEGAGLLRTGAHNIVSGTSNDWTSFGGAVLGTANKATNDYAAVLGGINNTASGARAAVLGGAGGTASGASSTVAGGMSNTASGTNAAVGGGQSNTAASGAAAVSGGFSNNASGSGASVSGGARNQAKGESSAISGGADNVAEGLFASVTAGQRNLADSRPCGTGPDGAASVSGGIGNEAYGCGSVVAGGRDNYADLTGFAAGGHELTASGDAPGAAGHATAIGGFRNRAAGPDSVVLGGQDNAVSSARAAAIVGGEVNRVDGELGSVFGGSLNTAGHLGVIAGGWFNGTTGTNGTVVGGSDNLASGPDNCVESGFSPAASTVTGGTGNEASGCKSTVSGGVNRSATGQWDWVAGALFQDG